MIPSTRFRPSSMVEHHTPFVFCLPISSTQMPENLRLERVSDASGLNICWLSGNFSELAGFQGHKHSSLYTRRCRTKLLVSPNS